MKYMDTLSSIGALKENVKHEKRIIKELGDLLGYLDTIENLKKIGYRINEAEKKLLYNTLKSLTSQLNILNNSLPEILRKISYVKEIPEEKSSIAKEIKRGKKEELISLKYEHPAFDKKGVLATVKKSEKARFLKELSLTNSTIKKLKKKYDYLESNKEVTKFKKPSKYAKYSNKFFSGFSNRLTKKGYLINLSGELRKANLPFLSHTYISMSFLSGFIAFFASLLLLLVLLFFNISVDYPFLLSAGESIGLRFLKYFWLVIVIPVLTFFILIFYPSLEKKSIAKKINQELPFVVIHMAAIAGSKVEPTNIFKIIVTGREYPHTKKEFKKILNQVNIYGYDLVSALRNSARITSSNRLSELFSGLATTITSGGDLDEFLAKRADTLIFNYKMERDKSTRVAETFMDIYISVVIAAPMIMTLLLVMMSVTPALSFGISLQATNLLMLLGIALINIIFIAFLHLKQPAI